MRQTTVFAGLFLGLWMTACAGDDTVQPNTRKDAGNDATVEGGGTDGAPVVDPSSLCAKYGGYAKVEDLVKGAIAAVKADCKIGAFFTNLPETGKVHLQDCLSKQVGEFMGCGVTYLGSKDSLGTACRSMAEAHQGVDPQIRQADFDAFLVDVIAALKAGGMTTDDIGKIAPSFNSTSGDVVQSQDQGYSNSTCPGTDGGQDAGTDAKDAADSAITDAADSG